MKYPQLVSSRALNAISDWLVSRLEQLGVESPLIYSRLLLSLLQSSIQLNDPIEFNNLETFLANRKGGNSKQRYPPSDTENLRKLYAVHCFMSTVSSEFEINTVEELIDDLCKKLRELEKEDESEDDDLKETTISTNKTEQVDPTKRYYNAFPALSKDMEDSVRILRNNCKSLTWPKTSQKQQQQLEKLSDRQSNIKPISTKSEKGHPNFSSVNTTGVKRKQRRRNQGINKTFNKNNSEQTNFTSRKKSHFGGVVGGSENEEGGIVNSKVSVIQRNCSSPTWDTDFEGSWEMGRDLIKEFLMKENNRNRSTSESAVSGLRENIYQEAEETDNTSNTVSTPTSTSSNAYNLPVDNEIFDSVNQFNQYDCNEQEQQSSSYTVFSDEGYSTHENLTMLSDIASGDAQSYLNPSRRLYERDISNESINSPVSEIDDIHQKKQNDLDFAQFRAKFDSNVEALWKGSDVVDSINSINNAQVQRIWNENKEFNSKEAYEEKSFFSMPPIQNTLYHDSLQSSIWQNQSIWSIGDDFIDKHKPDVSNTNFYQDDVDKEEQKQLLNNFPLDHISYKWSEGINGVSASQSDNPPQTTPLNSLINYESSSTLQNNTLANHSATESAFEEYSLIKPKMALLPRAQYTPKSGSRLRSLPSSEDNLINSADTHFTPIKQNYANGFTFSINSDVDEIDYILSEEGYMLLENQKYLEYKTPKDDVLDSQSTSSRSFTPSLDPIINVKFKVKCTEVACQTEEQEEEEEKLPENNFSPTCVQWPDAEICKNCTLWGNCFKCCQENMVTVPIPANRLLKDELSIEGDEIMANLKYLYIGTNTASWMDIPSSSETSEYDDNDDMLMLQSVTPVNNDYEMDSVANEVYKSVTKLISDLLQPVDEDDYEIGEGNDYDKDVEDGVVESIEIGEDDDGGGGGGSDHIWTQNLAKIWDDEGNECSSINWEYSNLAEIWKKDVEKKNDISQRLQSFLENATTCVSGKNRKRRHSASQKFYNNNNNNDVNCNNNNMMMKMMMLPPEQLQHQTIITCKYWTRKLDSTTDNSLNQQIQLQLNNNNDNINNLNSYNNKDENFRRNKIFIECTKDPLESSAIASALKIKLQHISRPLTR